MLLALRALQTELFAVVNKIRRNRYTPITIAFVSIILWAISHPLNIRHLAGEVCVGDIQLVSESQMVITFDARGNELPKADWIEAGDTITAVGFVKSAYTTDGDDSPQVIVEYKNQYGYFWYLMAKDEFRYASENYRLYQQRQEKIASAIEKFHQPADSTTMVVSK